MKYYQIVCEFSAENKIDALKKALSILDKPDTEFRLMERDDWYGVIKSGHYTLFTGGRGAYVEGVPTA